MDDSCRGELLPGHHLAGPSTAGVTEENIPQVEISVTEAETIVAETAEAAVTSALTHALQRSDPPDPLLVPILRFTGIPDIELMDFRAFLYQALKHFPVTVRITRIRLVKTAAGNQFFVKAWNNREAAWLLRAFNTAPTDDGYQMRVSVIQPSEWKAMFREYREEWGTERPLLPVAEDMQRTLLQRLNVSLQDRIQDWVIQHPTQWDLESRLTSEFTQQKSRTRGGKKKRGIAELYGPLRGEDVEEGEVPDQHQPASSSMPALQSRITQRPLAERLFNRRT
ncbi:hypothetical protein VKT23_009074 [Stygiomarasmius scandens]|uniref:Uncharacterized protein n=1 Tax=Marasmiellus scandens TaxID=2682957 RepID=A0ABR1JH07_9AGAR